MINLSKALMFLKKGAEICRSFETALARTFKYLNSITLNKSQARGFDNYYEVMSSVNVHEFDVERVLAVWYNICLAGVKGKSRWIPASLVAPGALSIHSHVPHELFVAFTKLFFIVLHKEKAVLLPYEFSRPMTDWFNEIETKFDIWAETIKPFRDLELARRATSSLDSQDATFGLAESRRGRRLIQCSSKLLLATDWYTVESINVLEVEEVRCKLLSRNFFITTPLPLLQVMEFLRDCYPLRASGPLSAWIDLQHLEVVRSFESSLRTHILAALNSDLDALHIAQTVFNVGYVPFTDFAHDKIGSWDIVGSVRQSYKLDIREAYNVWLECQQYFFDSKHLEMNRQYRSYFGRLNVWLFVYLPAWMNRNPGSKFLYPSAPNKFSGRFHYDCSSSITDRPLSLVEFYKLMGWIYNYNCATSYRCFFDVLIVSQDLDGCENLKQPVYTRPTSVKYNAVTKNIFPGGILLFYVEYLSAIERVSDFLFEDSIRLHRAFLRSERRNTFFSFENFGYVPFFYWEGECYLIKEISRSLLSFTMIGRRNYYNPGLIRFVLLLLEVGPRGQAGQWLDARTYDRLADRVSSHPLHLTTLCLNTDKVHSTPIFVITINRAIWLLDAQREWRDHMHKKCGASAFGNEIYYDGRSHTKWGKILPLFAYVGGSGEPFSDTAYAKFWTHCCFSFQVFLHSNGISDVQLVAYMPVSSTGRHIDWEKWVSGMVKPSSLKIVSPESDNGTIYSGVHSPLSFRAKVTPHGARASFVTEMSTLLSPEDVAMLTGQSAGQVVKYTKSDVLRRNLQGAYNWRDVRGQLNRASKERPRLSEVSNQLEDLRDSPDFIENASRKGWVTSATGPFKKALELIASDKQRTFGVSDTHICVLSFECSSEVIEQVGYRNCPYCPLAIYSVNNIVAVAAQRTLSYDSYRTLTETIMRRPQNWSDAEKLNDSRLLQSSGKEAIGWSIVEANLWAMIRSSNLENTQDLLVGDRDLVISSFQRYEVERDSGEDFFDRLANATVYQGLVSEDFKFKIDRATRLLMAGDGKIQEALLAPFGFSSAEALAAHFRNLADFENLDLVEYVKFVTMTQTEWTERLAQHRQFPNFLLEFYGSNKLA